MTATTNYGSVRPAKRGLTMERLDLSKYEGHTPGPWMTVSDSKEFVYALDVEGKTNRFSLSIQKGMGDCGRRIGDREIMSNRDLIADSPKLLDGLREAYDENDRLKAEVSDLTIRLKRYTVGDHY